jgi:hypothetical protein
MNAAICSLICGKPEKDAIEELNRFKCSWRVIMRDGESVSDLTPDRNDKRYNLVIKDGRVARVLPG